MADCRTGPEAGEEEIPGLRHTVWDQQDQKVQYPKLQKDVSADVVVVGAGIAGLSVA
jgi:NADPH-dependent 2,4-dienoyl-CoA reductase/sulfur reductase-like enzyme